MSEFFKAAVKCDVAMARQAPMYIDQQGVMEELYRHERLVEQALKTKLFLDDLEEQDKKRQASRRDVEEILGAGATVPQGLYKEPPMSLEGLAKPPSERNPGTRSMEREAENRLNLWRQNLDATVSSLKKREEEERKRAKEQEELRRRDAERELNALIATRQLTAHEAEREGRRIAVEKARQSNRVHPIDVLQKKIAADLLDEIEEGSRIVAAQMNTEEKGVDEIYELERTKEIKYKYHAPMKHVPAPW